MGNTLNEDIKCPHCGESIEADAEHKKYKQLYDRYNQCRDFQLDRFWKNSIFVWTFLAVCFTAYGALVVESLDDNKLCVEQTIFGWGAILVCVFGAILSLLWIWMAKGSKAWYEVYENAIWEIESLNNVFQFKRKFLIHNYWALKTNKKFKDKEIDERLFSTRAFSPSKIVIFIGWLLIIFWGNALFFSIGLLSNCYYIVVFPIIIDFVLFCCFFYYNSMLNSSTIRDYSANQLFKKICADKAIKGLNIYFNVEHNEVAFFPKTNKQRLLIKKHYQFKTKNEDDWIHYDYEVMYNHYFPSFEKEIDFVKKIFGDNGITPNNIEICKNTIYAHFKGEDYESDYNKIALGVNQLLTKYDTIKVSYNFNKIKQ